MVYVNLYKTGMEGTYDVPNTNPHFFVTTQLNRMGFFAELQIICYNVIILKHIQIDLQFRSYILFGTIGTV